MKRIKKRNSKLNPKLDDIALTNQEIFRLNGDLRLAFIYGSVNNLIHAITLSKIGNYCTDCKKPYFKCTCEFCPDCKLNRCKCDYNIDKTTDSDIIRRITLDFVKELFNETQFNQFKNDVLNLILYSKTLSNELRYEIVMLLTQE